MIKKLIITLISVLSLCIPHAHAMQQQQQVQRPQQQKPKQKSAEHAHDECACEHNHETAPQTSTATHEQAPEQEKTIPQETATSSDAKTTEHICTFGGHEPCSACNCERAVCKAPKCAAKIHTFKCIECGKTMELASQTQIQQLQPTTAEKMIAYTILGAYGALSAAYPHIMIPFNFGLLITAVIRGGCPG